MFTTLIVQPLFNILVAIYALIPGHNFGLAIILFTILVRLLLWPLLKKQLHQTKLMRKIQPELKAIKKKANGDRRKEQVLMMELYKERGINPFGQIGLMFVQLPILIGLYSGLQKILADPHSLVSFSYPFIQHLDWMKELATNISKFDSTLFGAIDLTKSALSASGIYWPALVLVLASAIVQFFQSKQLLPNAGDQKKVRDILREAKDGKEADQGELNAAMSRNLTFLLPAMVVMVTIHLAAALSLYWLVSGIVAFIQQTVVLREDVEEMETKTTTAVQREKKAQEARVVSITNTKTSTTKSSAKGSSTTKKRRKK